MIKMILAPILALLQTTPDLQREHLGPTVVWYANTPKGERFLRNLTARYRSPIVEVKDGKEVLTPDRSGYDPKHKSLYTSPSLQGEILRNAEQSGLRVKSDN